MAGWIKIHRDFQRHWIAQDFTRLGWWVDLLFLANCEDSRILVGNRLVDVKRGQMVVSYSYLAKRWKSTKSVVVSFISLLEANTMIERFSERKLTILTICNYDSYILENDIAKNDARTMHERCATNVLPISSQSSVQLSDCNSDGYVGSKNDDEPISIQCGYPSQESPLSSPSSFSPTPPFITPPIIPQENKQTPRTYERVGEEAIAWDADRERSYVTTFTGQGSALPFSKKVGKTPQEVMKLLEVYMATRELKNLGHKDYSAFINLFIWHVENNKISIPVAKKEPKVITGADIYKVYG